MRSVKGLAAACLTVPQTWFHYCCPVKVEASDSSQTISGPSVLESEDGVYNGPDRSALSGLGMLEMTRVCTFKFEGTDTDFDVIKATYTSTAKSDVTWFTPNA